MIIERITFGKTIAMPGYNNDKPEVEAILEDGETLESVLSALNKRLTDWHKAEYPHLYQESKPTHLPGGEAWISAPVNALPQVIDLKEVRAKEELDDQILSATSLNELAIIKEACGKAGLVTQYMKRLNELMTNG